VESALWIKLSSSSADLTIYAGDFNTEPKERFSQYNCVFEGLEINYSDSLNVGILTSVAMYLGRVCDIFMTFYL
jgi:hypothetical protein